jgi:hypothetical protein
MKRLTISFVLLLIAGIVSLQAQTTTPAQANDNGIKWEQKTYDFGNIPQNVPAKGEFMVTNTGDDPLILTNVKGSCGCTATGYSKDPIAPGESTTITATYNARRVGPFNKTIRVNTNRDASTIVLNIKGKVEAAQQETNPNGSN